MKPRTIAWPLVGALLVLTVTQARAQEVSERDHVIVFELGAANDWGLTGSAYNAGLTLAAEVTPIEHWLELESGVTALGTNGQHQLEADFIFKKPWTLSSRAEFMAGLGPEVSWSLTGNNRKPSLATELATDFMYWASRDFGWFAEPTYSFTGFGSGSARSIGLSIGVIVGWP